MYLDRSFCSVQGWAKSLHFLAKYVLRTNFCSAKV